MPVVLSCDCSSAVISLRICLLVKKLLICRQIKCNYLVSTNSASLIDSLHSVIIYIDNNVFFFFNSKSANASLAYRKMPLFLKKMLPLILENRPVHGQNCLACAGHSMPRAPRRQLWQGRWRCCHRGPLSSVAMSRVAALELPWEAERSTGRQLPSAGEARRPGARG